MTLLEEDMEMRMAYSVWAIVSNKIVGVHLLTWMGTFYVEFACVDFLSVI